MLVDLSVVREVQHMTLNSHVVSQQSLVDEQGDTDGRPVSVLANVCVFVGRNTPDSWKEWRLS